MKFLVLAGTKDGRLLAEELLKRGHEVLVSTLTEYGAELAGNCGLPVRHGALAGEELTFLLQENSFTALIDATHPYATRIKEIARAACLASKVPYLRWERPPIIDPLVANVYWSENISEAAELAAGLGKRILLTVGSNSLPEWLGRNCLRERTLYVRVLPKSEVLKKCENLGLKPFQIIAAQGPFTQAFNEALIQQYKIDVLVAKESGTEGGTPEKIRACQKAGIPLILLRRPDGQKDESITLSRFIEKLEEELWTRK